MEQLSIPSLEQDLRIPAKPVFALLLIPGLALALVAFFLPDTPRILNTVPFFWALAILGWVVDDWNPRVGRWFALLEVVGAIQLVHHYLHMPGILALMAVPTALAAPLIGLRAALVAATGESLLLVALYLLPIRAVSSDELAVATLAIWSILGIMLAVYTPVRKLAIWAWEHFSRAQRLLDEARDRQAELRQVLDDLAHANRQLALSNEKLAIARLVAEEAQKTKAAFVAKVSHEFRTPLNMIIGLTDLLVEAPEVYGELPPELLEDLEIVNRNCAHLASMINDVLDLSQIEAGRLALHREYVDLAEVIQGAWVVVLPLLEKKKLELHVSVPDDLPQVYCDRTRIRQVILNLVSNAARFTEKGGITVQAELQEQKVVIMVRDTGPGISDADAGRIFEPFYQGATRLWRSKDGSGLGLAISRQFVEMHNGRMWFESEIGVGSSFFFDLPVSPLSEHAAPPARWISEGWVQRTSKAEIPVAHLEQRVILCDESGELGPLFVRYSDEVEFVDTRDLEQAKQELQRAPAQAIMINSVSVDRLWPAIERARQDLSDIPIIGCSVPPSTEHARAAHASGYLLKPVTLADLEQALAGMGRTPQRVLVVDDDPDALQLFARMLRLLDSNLEILTACNGSQALDLLRSRQPDVMLLDLVLPDMDGWHVLAIKSQEPELREIPVIVVSAQDPRDQPLESRLLVATMGKGLSLSKLLRCSHELASLLLQPD